MRPGLRPRLGLSLVLAIWLSGAEAGWPIKLAQQPGNVLEDFLAYRHVAIIHFDLPPHAVSVGFKFTAKEEKIGGLLGECPERDITINVKSGSLPLVQPDGSKIRAKLLKNRRRNYTVEALSNGDEHIVNIVAPPPGDWYAIAYRSWFDPNSGKIQQQGVSASCETLLNAELLIERADVTLPFTGSNEHRVNLDRVHANSSSLEFLIDPTTEWARFYVSSSCGENCSIFMHASSTEPLFSQIVNSSEISIEFRAPNDADSPVHVVLMLHKGPPSEIVVKLEPVERAVPKEKDQKAVREGLSEIALTRKSLPDFFLFDYEHVVGNSSKPVPMNISADALGVMRFKVGSVYDTGGTLSVGLKIADDYKHKDENGTLVVVGCLNYGYFARIRPNGRCERSSRSSLDPPDLHVNSSKLSPSFVHAPFPEPGLWHLTTKAFCVTRTGCDCFESCIRPENSSTNSSISCDDEPSCDCVWECPARIETSIASSPCIEGGCGEHGRCMPHMSGGFVFSSCYCNSGYRGFDCADDAYVTSRARALATLLMLTLSNLAFLGAIFVAVVRGYYTEAVVYTAVMVFSSSYHACEAGIDVFHFEKEHSLCLTRLNVLQFCDFFHALLSIWVTLVAMASLGPRATSFAHMLGVVVLAVGAELDRTALWVFLMPVVCGCLLVVLSWAYKCRQKGTLKYPARTYRLVYLPIGLTVVLIGMICYAFLQTRRNYYILHSLWHVCVAAGVVLLLPKRHYME